MFEDSPAVQVRMKTLRILWFAMVMSTLMIAGVYFYLRSMGSVPAQPMVEPVLLYAFSFLALGEAAASFIVPQVMAQKAAAEMGLSISSETPDEKTVLSILLRYQTIFIVGMALCESVTLFGLVLGMLGFQWINVVPLFALGTFLLLLRFPSAQSAVASFRR